MTLLGYGKTESANFADLLGQTINELRDCIDGNDLVAFVTDDSTYVLGHSQECCEHVTLAEVIGDPSEMVGSPIVMAEISVNTTDPMPEGLIDDGYDNYSHTWSFYRLQNEKGAMLVLRWLGTSNGYYSETVDFAYVLP